MKRAEVFPSPFFKAGDLNGREPVLTIKQVSTELLSENEERRVLTFVETDKKLVLNKTNWSKCAEITHEDDDERWIGRRIRLVTERVAFRGDLVDAIRVAVPDQPF
jgi:hypothetical protein